MGCCRLPAWVTSEISTLKYASIPIVHCWNVKQVISHENEMYEKMKCCFWSPWRWHSVGEMSMFDGDSDAWQDVRKWLNMMCAAHLSSLWQILYTLPYQIKPWFSDILSIQRDCHLHLYPHLLPSHLTKQILLRFIQMWNSLLEENVSGMVLCQTQTEKHFSFPGGKCWRMINGECWL